MRDRTSALLSGWWPFCQLLQYRTSVSPHRSELHSWDTRGHYPFRTDVSSLDSVVVWLL